MNLIPKSSCEYRKKEYWEWRYKDLKTEEKYDWLIDSCRLIPLLQKVLENFNRNSNILYLGCGNSSFPLEFYPFYPNICSIDYSENLIQKLTDNHTISEKYPELIWKVVDIIYLQDSFKSECFDVVIDKCT